MERTAMVILIIFSGDFFPKQIKAQGTTYASNLSRSSTGSFAVGSDAWFAGHFTAGHNASGYELNSIQLKLNGTTGNPSGFSVSIYSEGPSIPIFPETFLGSLTGPNPSTAGTYTFAASTEIMLLSATRYFVVLTAATPVAVGSYDVSHADTSINYDFSDGWVLGPLYLESGNGSSWSPTRFVSRLQFAVNATAVPEPSAVSLLLLGGGVLVCARRSG